MAVMIDSEFTMYALTEDETLQGAILTITQKQVLQNRRSMIASQKLNLEYNTENPDKFTQEEAFLRGQLEFAGWMLDSSDAAVELMNNPPEAEPSY